MYAIQQGIHAIRQRIQATPRQLRTGSHPPLASAAVALTLGVLSSTSLAADAVVVYRAHDVVDPAAVARILSAQPRGLPPGVRTRSIQMTDGIGGERPAATASPSRQLGTSIATTPSTATRVPTVIAVSGVASAPPVAAPVPTTLSLPVPFAFNSANLLPQARLHLDAVAEGIKLLPADRAVIIEGHTDAHGPDAYNMVLSQRRASAVRDYLSSRHQIGAQRLRVIGLGELDPLSGTDPGAGVNRRVQFRGA